MVSLSPGSEEGLDVSRVCPIPAFFSLRFFYEDMAGLSFNFFPLQGGVPLLMFTCRLELEHAACPVDALWVSLIMIGYPDLGPSYLF